MIFADGSDEYRRIATGDGFDESVDGRRLAFLLTNVRAAAKEWHELGRERLALAIGKRGPDSGEERDPQRWPENRLPLLVDRSRAHRRHSSRLANCLRPLHE